MVSMIGSRYSGEPLIVAMATIRCAPRPAAVVLGYHAALLAVAAARVATAVISPFRTGAGAPRPEQGDAARS
jgi:hypothetical protein